MKKLQLLLEKIKKCKVFCQLLSVNRTILTFLFYFYFILFTKYKLIWRNVKNVTEIQKPEILHFETKENAPLANTIVKGNPTDFYNKSWKAQLHIKQFVACFFGDSSVFEG